MLPGTIVLITNCSSAPAEFLIVPALLLNDPAPIVGNSLLPLILELIEPPSITRFAPLPKHPPPIPAAFNPPMAYIVPLEIFIFPPFPLYPPPIPAPDSSPSPPNAFITPPEILIFLLELPILMLFPLFPPMPAAFDPPIASIVPLIILILFAAPIPAASLPPVAAILPP